jgi:PAS domain-containing protein
VNDLRELLASSLDAIVVTNGDHRLVSANPKALHLFGVSEKNIRQFTIDAFLLENEILYFNGNGLPFISREENQGMQIKRRTEVCDCDYVCVANLSFGICSSSVTIANGRPETSCRRITR